MNTRFVFALERAKPSDWERFEKLASEFLAPEWPSIRTVATPSGDGGRDAELFSPDGDPSVLIQYSVAEDWERKIKDTLTIFNAFPRPALAPIFILWFGLGALPKITVAVTIVFFVLVLNTMAGIGSVGADVAFLSRALGMTSWQRFRLVELPHAMPTIVAGLRLGAVYAVLGVVVSEIVAANEGLGQLLVQYTNQFSIAELFAVLALMAALAIVLDFGISLIQRRMSWLPNSGAGHH